MEATFPILAAEVISSLGDHAGETTGESAVLVIDGERIGDSAGDTFGTGAMVASTDEAGEAVMSLVGDPAGESAGESAVLVIDGERIGESAGDTLGAGAMVASTDEAGVAVMPLVGDPAGESAVLVIDGERIGESAGDTLGAGAMVATTGEAGVAVIPSVVDPAGESAVLVIDGERIGESAGVTFGLETRGTAPKSTTVAVLARRPPTRIGAMVAPTVAETGVTVFLIGVLEIMLAVGDPTGESPVLVIDGERIIESVGDNVGLETGDFVPDAKRVGVLVRLASTGTGAMVAPTDDDAGDPVGKGELEVKSTGAVEAKIALGDVALIGENPVLPSIMFVVGTNSELFAEEGKSTTTSVGPCMIAGDPVGGTDSTVGSELNPSRGPLGIGPSVEDEFRDVVGDEAGDDACSGEDEARELSTIALIDGGIEGVVFC